jgi:hypothetical protein
MPRSTTPKDWLDGDSNPSVPEGPSQAPSGGGFVPLPDTAIPPPADKPDVIDPYIPAEYPDAPKKPKPGMPREGGYGPDSRGIPSQGYAGSGILGESAMLQTPMSIGRAFRGNEQDARAIILRDFTQGIVTRYDRGQQPIGSVYDIQNFLLNSKAGGLELRYGVSNYAGDGESAITAYGSQATLNDSDRFFRMSTEIPASQSVEVLTGEDDLENKRIFQRGWWNGAGTLNSSDWLWWGDRYSYTIDGAPSGASIVLSSAASSTNDYYNGAIIYNASRSSKYLFVTDYTGSSKTLLLSENIPADWASGDSVVIYRHFHDNAAFAPLHTFLGTTCLQQGNAVLLCGGRGTTEGYKPMWSGYISKTFMTGTTPFAYTGTYVTEAEIKTGSGVTSVVGNSTETGDGLPEGKRFFVAYVIETDDGIRSGLIVPTTNYYTIPDASTDVTLTLQLKVFAALLNKRIRYVNIFAGYSDDTDATQIPWQDYYQVARWDLTDGTGWTHQATATNDVGYHHRTLELTNSLWQTGYIPSGATEKENLTVHLGSGEFLSATCSYNRAVLINDRLIVGDFYDYANALTYTDQIRTSVFASNGIGQINSLRDLDEVTQSTIAQGDDTSVKALVRFQDSLLVLKDRSCYSIAITDNVGDWTLTTLSSVVGCDAPLTAKETPFGVMWANSEDDVYLWQGGQVRSAAMNWRPFYRTFTTPTFVAAYWEAWYDAYTNTYNLGMSSATGFTTYYQMYFDLPLADGQYAWGRGVLRPVVQGITIGTNGVVYMVNADASFPEVYKFDPTATTDDGVGIQPYLDTGDYTLTEQDVVQFRDWHVSQTPTGGSGNLDIDIQIDGGTKVSGLTGLTLTSTRLSSGLPVTSNGRTIRLKYNTNGTKASFTGFSLHEIGFRYRFRERRGDRRKSL